MRPEARSVRIALYQLAFVVGAVPTAVFLLLLIQEAERSDRRFPQSKFSMWSFYDDSVGPTTELLQWELWFNQPLQSGVAGFVSLAETDPGAQRARGPVPHAIDLVNNSNMQVDEILKRWPGPSMNGPTGTTLQNAVAQTAVTRAAVDRAFVLAGLKENFERAMQHVPIRDAKGKETGQHVYNGHVANRALELIGKELGMFMERFQSLLWDGDMSKLTDLQLKNLLEQFGKLAGLDPANEGGKAA